MKNLIIAMMATYIFYTDFCVMHIPVVIPFVVFLFWAVLEEAEELATVYLLKVKRGKRLGRKIKQLRRR